MRRRTTDSACAEKTRKPPVRSAIAASRVRFTRYERDSRDAWLSPACGGSAMTPAGSSACTRARAVPASTATHSSRAAMSAVAAADGGGIFSARRRSMRESRPSLPKRSCTAAMSISARRGLSAAPGMSPATRSATSPAPACSRSVSPGFTPSASCAARARKIASSARTAKRSPPPAAPAAGLAGAGLGSSAGVTCASANTSTPTSCRRWSPPAICASISTIGLAAITSGSAATCA